MKLCSQNELNYVSFYSNPLDNPPVGWSNAAEKANCQCSRMFIRRQDSSYYHRTSLQPNRLVFIVRIFQKNRKGELSQLQNWISELLSQGCPWQNLRFVSQSQNSVLQIYGEEIGKRNGLEGGSHQAQDPMQSQTASGLDRLNQEL